MTTGSINGTRAAAFEDEAWGAHEISFEDPFNQAALEDEWETDEAGSPFAAYEDPYGEAAGEWSAREAAPFAAAPEDEWPGVAETVFEDEWAAEGPYEAGLEDEADPFLGGLAARALPALARAAAPAVRRLLPAARQAAPGVVRAVLGGAGPSARTAAVDALLRQLRALLREGEIAAAEAEAQFFGAGEQLGEVAGHELAHEAALTEVLAAEAAHTESDGEAQALLGATLPLTIRVMRARGATRSAFPILIQANARLVRGIRRSGPAGRQLARLVPPIQRRTVASIAAAHRQGRPVPPESVPRVMAAQAARVLGTPRLAGPALLRNTAVRRATVAPAGSSVPRRQRRSGHGY